MDFVIKKFNELTVAEVYKLLQLRSEVFVVEQDCVYQDIDFKDQKAYHVLGYKNNTIVAYARIFDSNDYFNLPSIGRILVDKAFRKDNLGHQLVEKSIEFIANTFQEKSIVLSAQCYLKKFYNSHGFVEVGEEYLEDGIPHIKMKRS